MKAPSYLLLLRRLDAPLSPTDQARLTDALSRDPALQAAEQQLLAQRAQLQAAGAAATFGPFFTAKVLQRLQASSEAPAPWVAGLSYAFGRVALPALAVVTLAVLGMLSSASTLSWEVLTGVEAISAADVWGEVLSF